MSVLRGLAWVSLAGVAGLGMAALLGFEEANATVLVVSALAMAASPFGVAVHLVATKQLTRAEKTAWARILLGRQIVDGLTEYMGSTDRRASLDRLQRSAGPARRVHLRGLEGRSCATPRARLRGSRAGREVGPRTRDCHGRKGVPQDPPLDRRPGKGGSLVKIRSVTANTRRKVFEVTLGSRVLPYPFSRTDPCPSAADAIREVVVDPEVGREAFWYVLASGARGYVHVEQVLDYNDDPSYMRDQLLYRLTLEAQRRLEESPLSTREVTRRLGTSAAQLYRLLDQTNYRKSVDQLLTLLSVLDCEVEVIVRARGAA